ncbi:MAG TPA: 50S ribosomal protein L29 [Rectinemataceae bacterium]|nr:50S ribosomal protein L29 [Rectinemataceae bacterium]
MAVKNSFKELRPEELLAKREELKKKYFDLRFQSVVGHVDNPVEKRVLRRQIARAETLIRRAEILGAATQGAGASANAEATGARKSRGSK